MRYTRWDSLVSEEDSDGLLKDLALRHFQEAGSVADVPAGLLARGDYRGLVDYPLDYCGLSEYAARHLRQGLALFQKRRDLDIGYDREAVARRKFTAAEERCRLTNESFRKRREGKFQFFPRTERVLFHAARKISHLLGPAPLLSELALKFGPGATTQIPKREASARAKLGTNPSCSVELAPTAHLVWDELPAWANALKAAGPLPMLIEPGKVVFVPKSAKEDRSVMVEPSLNTLVQGGIGRFMARRLLLGGIDIRDQAANQRSARKGSLDGSLATVDLSSASDTVSLELVYDLLPEDWFFLLSRARTGTALFEDSLLRLEKFSSMGNGYTFPLETTIFYALTYGVCVELGLPTREVRAYGDDIICPSAGYPLLTRVLSELGFEVNLSKSFSDGPFRESCGADYFQGIDIRPVYLKDRPLVADLFRLHNFYKLRFCDWATDRILELLDPSIRIYGPEGYGDGHLIGDWVPSRKASHEKRGWGGSVFDTFTWKSRRSFRTYVDDRVLPVYSTYLREEWAGDEGSSGSSHGYLKGQLWVTVPGVRGVNRISIYTFMR